MKSFVFPRCQPHLQDSCINKQDIIQPSSYLPYSLELEGGVQKNLKYIQHCVQEAMICSYKLIALPVEKATFHEVTTMP